MEGLLSFIPILFILNAGYVFVFRRYLGPIGTFYLSIGSGVIVLLGLLILILQVLRGGGYWFIDLGRWFFCLNVIDMHLLFCFDLLSLVSAAMVVALVTLAMMFGVEYMYREAFINRLLYLLNLFAMSVFLLFFCYDVFLVLFAWECIGLFSLLLVNFYSTRVYTIKAALKTFILSRLSDCAMFIMFIFTLLVFQTTDLSLIFIQVPFLIFHYCFVGSVAFHFLTLYTFLLAVSGGIKSAQVLAHVWLPDAMEAPTPASALIHSSTLVVAGIFLILRFSLIFEFTPMTNRFLGGWGAFTLVFAAVVATFQTDIKKLVAFSTISQIGYLVCGVGFLCYEEVLTYLIIHAVNKAFLFMGVGYIVHFFRGNTDLRQMGGGAPSSFELAVLMVGVSVNLCGLPYTAGFIGKEFLIFQFFGDEWFAFCVRACWLISFICTPLYMGLLVILALFGNRRGDYTTYYSSYRFGWEWGKGIFGAAIDQASPIISRPASLVLGSFWLGIFWGGEELLMLLANFGTPLAPINRGDWVHLTVFSGWGGMNLSPSLLTSFQWFLMSAIGGGMLFLLELKYVTLHDYWSTHNYVFLVGLIVLSLGTSLESLAVLGFLWASWLLSRLALDQ